MDNREGELSEGCGCLVLLAALTLLIVTYRLLTAATAALGG